MTLESFHIGPGAESFEVIKDPDKNLVIWSREPDLGLRLWLESQLHELRWAEARVPIVDQRLDLSPLVEKLPCHPMRDKLLADLDHLGRCFVRLLPTGAMMKLKASLGPVLDDQCRKLHVDWVLLRMLTTYIGPGTEWLPNAAVDREHVGASACCPTDANRAIMRAPNALRRARAGEVLLMKGEAWPGNTGKGLVHRSPAIEGLGETLSARLVFTLSALAPPRERSQGQWVG